MLRALFLLIVAYIAAAHNLASTAVITATAPYTDGITSANIAVVNDGTVSYIPSATNWANYLYRTADSAAEVSLTLNFGAVYTINTVFIAFGENNMSQEVALIIGDTICGTATGSPASQWIQCPTTSSQYLSLVNTGTAQHDISVTEIMVYEEYLITPYSAVASSTYAGSDVANSMILDPYLTTADQTSCFSTAGGESIASITYNFKANFNFDSMVMIGVPTPDSSLQDFSSGTTVTLSTNINGAISQSGQFTTIGINPEADFQYTAGAIATLTRSDILAFCSVGFLTSDCASCQNTKFTSNDIVPEFYVSPASLILGTTQGSTTSLVLPIGDPNGVGITVYDVSTLPNSLALICGDTLKCGETILVLCDTLTSTEIDMTDPANFITYDLYTSTITFKTNDPLFAGDHDYILKARLADYPELGYFPSTTDFTVKASIFCTMQDLINAANDVSLTQGGFSIDTFTFWAYKDFASPQDFEISLLSSPTCNGFLSVAHSAIILTATATPHTVVDSSNFATCIASFSQSCITLNDSTLSLFIFDESLTGANTVGIITTLTAFNGLTTISFSGQADFTLQVNSCYTTNLNSLLITSNPSNQNIYAFNYRVPDPAITFDFTIPDSMSQSQGDDTYCLSRLATITANDANSAPLLSCTATDCISVTSSDGYTFTLSMIASNIAYSNQVFNYQITVYLSQFAASSAHLGTQPSQTFNIAVTTSQIVACTLLDLQKIQVMSFWNDTQTFTTQTPDYEAYIGFIAKFRRQPFVLLKLPTCDYIIQYSPKSAFPVIESLVKPYLPIIPPYQPVSTDWAAFQTCMDQKIDISCFVFSEEKQGFYLYVQDESWTGVTSVQLDITFVAPQLDGSQLTSTNTVYNTITVYSCRNVNFVHPMTMSYNSWDALDTTYFEVYNNKPMPKIVVRFDDDLYLEDYSFNPDYCGPRNVVLTPTLSAINEALAQELIDCQDILNCVSMQHYDAYQFNVMRQFEIAINDMKYYQLPLEFTVVVQLQNFIDLPADYQVQGPVQSYQLTIYFTSKEQCATPDDLLGITFYNGDLQFPRLPRADTSRSMLSYDVPTGYGEQGEDNFNLGISNFPLCVGFDINLLTFTFVASFRNGTSMQLSQDEVEFNACKLLNNQNCFYYQLNKTTGYEYNNIYYYIRDESITQDWTTPWADLTTGPNVIYEYVNAYAYASDGSLLSNTYLVDQVNLFVYTCRYIVFDDKYQVWWDSKGAFTAPVTHASLSLKAFMGITIHNNATTDNTCGSTVLKIKVSPLNTNPALAQLLLEPDCYKSSTTQLPCLYAERETSLLRDDRFYRFYIRLRMNGDPKFLNQHLMYDIVATFEIYEDPEIIVQRNDWPTKSWPLEIHPIMPNQCNVTSDLSGLDFYSARAAPFIPLNDNFFYQTAYTQSFIYIAYSFQNLPTCYGFDNSLTTLVATMTFPNGSTEDFLPDSATWDACAASYSKSCFALDQKLLWLRFFVFDETVTGISQITLTATLYAIDSSNQLMSLVVQKTYNYHVKSCGVSVFSTPVVISSSFSDPNNWNYNINSQTKTYTFTIEDSISNQFLDSTYCGARTLAVNVATSETNPLAAELLACTASCLKASTDATGYVLTLTLSISEVKYADTFLQFTYKVQFQPYSTITQFTQQPFYTKDFAIAITNDPTCAFIEQLQGLYFVDQSGAIFDGLSFSNYAFLDFTSGPQVIQLQAINQPICTGLQPIAIAIEITKADGTTAQGAASQTVFDTCVASKSQSCFYIDATYAFKYYIYDTSYLGLNTITLVPTMSGLNSNSVLTVYTYNLAESATITLQLLGDCLFTTFQQPVIGSVTGMPDMKTNLRNPLPPTIFDVEDSVSVTFADSSYCGSRIYMLQSADNNPLSLNLLTCATNCLQLTSSANTLTISLRVDDAAYLGLSLPFTLRVMLSMYNSIPEANNPQTTFSFNVIIFAQNSCMSTVFNTPVSFNTTSSMTSVLQMRAQVKSYKSVNSKDPYSDVNFPYTRYYIQSTDTVSVSKAVPTYCGVRDFKLAVATNETNYLATQLMGNQSLSKMYFVPYNDYTYLIAIRIMEDVYTGQSLSFNLTIWLNQYHSNSTVGEPSASYNLLLLIDSCVIQSAFLSPLNAQSVQYYINTTINPLQFTINRVPNCANSAQFSLQAQSLTNQTLINSTYGIYVTANTNGFNADLMMTIFSQQYSLVNSIITITLTSLDQQKPQQFGIVSLQYLCKVQGATLTPVAETAYTYQIGTVMSSLQYFVTRSSACDTLGVINIIVTIYEIEDYNYENYGIIVSQSQSETVTQINLASYYNSTELNYQPMNLQLSYQVDGLDFTFASITAMYVNSSVLAKQSDPPYFTTVLATAADIQCLNQDSKWIYKLPSTEDPHGYAVKSTFSCPNLSKVIKFDSVDNVLTFDSHGVLPAPGGQDCKITLSNSIGAFQSYTLKLFVVCNVMANGTLWNWTAASRNKTVIPPPVPKIQATSRYGDLYIYWNKPMIMKNLSGNYSNQVQQATVRQLQGQVLNVVYSQESDPLRIRTQNLNYTYSIYWVDEITTAISIKYQNPQYVSAQSAVKDKIMVTFDDAQFFQSKDGQYINTNITLETTVPKQITPDQIDLGLNQSEGQTLAQTLLLSAFVCSFFMSYTIYKLLSIIENLVIILHYFILTLEYPANVQDFFAFLFPLVIFDALPTDGLYQQIFDFEDIEDTPISDQFAEVGYGNTIIIQNMGSFWLITNIIIALTIIITLLSCLPLKQMFCCCGKQVQSRADNYLQLVYWNGVIKFIESNYLCLLLMAVIGLTNLRLDMTYTGAEQYNSILAIIIFVILSLFPFIITLLYCKKLKSSIILPDPQDAMQIETIRYLYQTTDFELINKHIYTKSQHDSFMKTYGILLEDIDLLRLGKTQAIAAAVMPTLHKLFLVVIIMTTLPQPIIAIMAFNWCSMLIIIWIYHANPYTSFHYKRRLLLNEFALLIFTYHLYCLTEWQDIDIQYRVGNSVITFMIMQSFFVLQIEIRPIFHNYRLHCIRMSKRRRAQKRRKQRKAANIQVEPYTAKTQAQPDIVTLETVSKPIANKRRTLLHDETSGQLQQIENEAPKLDVKWQQNFLSAIELVQQRIDSLPSVENVHEMESRKNDDPDNNFSFRTQQVETLDLNI